MLVFISPLVVDLVTNGVGTETVAAFNNNAGSPYHAQLTLAKVTIELTEMTAKGRLSLAIAANAAAPDIELVVFGFIPSADALVYTSADPKTAGADGSILTGQTGDHFPTAEVQTSLEAPLHTIRKRNWYPFDRYDFSVAPQGCVGAAGCEKSFLVTDRMSARLAEQQFVITQRAESDAQHPGGVNVTYTVERPFFVR
jgi:hypothetical protein